MGYSRIDFMFLTAWYGSTPSRIGGTTGMIFACDDAPSGPVVDNVPVPTATGTNFSWVRHVQPYPSISVSGIVVTNLKFAKSVNEQVTGTRLWYVLASSYTQSTSPPAPTSDNNVTPPTINGVSAAAVPLAPTLADYEAGPLTCDFNVPLGTHYIDMVLGVDATATAPSEPADYTQLTVSTLHWEWDEG